MGKTYVVGIAGGSASGKSTFAEALAKTLDNLRVRMFHMDSYFKKKEERPHTQSHVSGIVYRDDNHPLTADLPKLADDIASAVEKQEYDVIIVEGFLTLSDDAISAMLDLKLFIDCRADERIVRRIKRNMAWGLTFDEISNVYLDMVRFRHDQYVEPSKWRADMILNGSFPSEKALKIISDTVEKSVRG